MTNMDGETWAIVREKLATVLELDTGKRAGYLEQLAYDEPEIAMEVAELLLESADFSEATELPWKQIGDYELIREIGRGGSSIVFAARKEGLDRTVALKLLLAKCGGSTGNDEFRREQQALSQLRHPGIVSLLDGGRTEGGLQFLVLELIEGKSIDVHSNEHCGSLKAVVQLFARLCEAVAAAHDAGVIHRDIKPANVLVDDAQQPRLFDFGVSKVGSPGQTTRPAAMTVSYASPEQVLAKPVTAASDVYSLGALGHLLLTGSPVYQIECDDMLALLRAICEDPWTPPKWYQIAGARTPAIRTLNAILGRCLQKDPSKRYQSARPLYEDLDRWLRGESIAGIGGARSLWPGGYYFKRRLGNLLIVALATLLVLAGLNVLLRREVKTGAENHKLNVNQLRAETTRLIHANLDELQNGLDAGEPLPQQKRAFLLATITSLNSLVPTGIDAALLYDVGVAHSLMSRVGTSKDGEVEQALAQAMEAHRCFFRLHEAAPDQVSYQLALGRNCIRMAELFEIKRDADSAFSAYREAGTYLRSLPPAAIHLQLVEAVGRKESAGHLLATRQMVGSGLVDYLEEADVHLLIAEAELRNGLLLDARRSCRAAQLILRTKALPGLPLNAIGDQAEDLKAWIFELRGLLQKRLVARVAR